jgi:hypothetical protein
MANVNFYVNNVLAPPPDNAQELEIELSFENDSPEASVRTTTFVWTGDNAALINLWLTSGNNGSVGILEGIPFRIEVCDPNIICFDGCIDATTTGTTFSCDIVRAGAQETNRIDSLNYKAEGFTFSVLKRLPVNTAGRLLTTDYVKVPYVISDIPDYNQVAILGLSFVEMVRILGDTINTLQLLINDFIGKSTPPLSPAAVALQIISILLYMLYVIFLIIMLIRLFKLMVANIIQAIKYKYGMRIDKLFTRAAEYLQLSGFSSTILQSGNYRNAVIIPKKTSSLNSVTFNDVFFGSTVSRKTYDDSLNLNSAIPSYGYYDGTFWQLIQDCKTLFNARVSIRNNVLYFERWDHFNLQSGYVMPNQSSESPFEDPYGTNASELSCNYFVKYQLDSSDFNTYDQYDGTSCQALFRPVIVNNINNVLLKNLKYIQFPFALGKRKTTLTYPEKVLGVIGSTVNNLLAPVITIVNAVNAAFGSTATLPSFTSSLFGTRIGALLLSNDFTSIPKFVIVNDPDARGISYLSPNNQTLTSALSMQNNFHSASWIFDANGNAPNQYLTYNDKEIPLCCSDFVILKDNNIITSYNQLPARIDSLRWKPWVEQARVSFRVKYKWTSNLILKLISNAE